MPEKDRQKQDRTLPAGPVIGVGALVQKDGRVLLIQRGRFPGVGQWAIPGGKQRFGETLQQAAEREVLEETGVVIEAGAAIYCFEAMFDAAGAEWPATKPDENDASETGRSGTPDETGPENRPAHHYVVVDLAATYISGEARAGDDATEARWFSPEEATGLALQKATRRFLNHVGFL